MSQSLRARALSRGWRLVLVGAMAAYPLLGQAAPAAAQEEIPPGVISPRHVPRDAPRFQDHPVPVYRGPAHPPDVRSHPESRRYRSAIREAARQKPNFAGHYVVARWGCGTGCIGMALVDLRTGKVHHPAALRMWAFDGIDADEDQALIDHRPDSRLLVAWGTPENDQRARGISWFVWDNDRLRRVRLVPRPWPN